MAFRISFFAWAKVAVLVAWLLPFRSVGQCDPVHDSLELVKFFDATGGVNWKNNTNWKVAGKKISTWSGVEINSEGCVTELDLDDNNLTGTLINFELPNLEWFKCSRNQLTDTIPNFDKLPNLEYFQCGENQLTGTIPNFDKLPNLYEIACFRNQLTGTIPNFDKLPKLKNFNCHENQLKGSIPNFDKLPNLLYFFCNENQLTGSIPNFDKLPNLLFFDCGENQLTGSIPNFDKLPNLYSFICQLNQLTGSIPNFDKLPNLSSFICQLNQLTGAMPNFDKLPNINFFSCNNNKITSKIPIFDKFSNLEYFWCWSNNFTFQDILPNVGVGISFNYFPQDSIFKDTTLSAYPGEKIDISLDVDEDISTNIYRWFKNGVFQFEVIGDNNFKIQSFQPTDVGDWHVEVTNPNVPDLTLFSKKITLQVSESLLPENTETDVFTPDGDGLNDEFIIQELEADPAAFPGNEFIVVNRWGDRVFTKKITTTRGAARTKTASRCRKALIFM